MTRRRWPTVWFAAVVLLGVTVGAAWLADWRVLAVRTGSMEPVVPEGAAALVAPVAPRQVAVGDVISFRDPGDRSRQVLHRVVEVVEQPGGLAFRTAGDNNRMPDPMLIPAGDVTGRLRFNVPHAGTAATVLAPPGGLVVLAGAPLLALAALELVGRRRSNRPRGEEPSDEEHPTEGVMVQPA